MIHFDPSLTLGTVVNVLSFVLGGLWFVRRIEKRMDRTEWRVALMWRAFCEEKGIVEIEDGAAERIAHR